MFSVNGCSFSDIGQCWNHDPLCFYHYLCSEVCHDGCFVLHPLHEKGSRFWLVNMAFIYFWSFSGVIRVPLAISIVFFLICVILVVIPFYQEPEVSFSFFGIRHKFWRFLVSFNSFFFIQWKQNKVLQNSKLQKMIWFKLWTIPNACPCAGNI